MVYTTDKAFTTGTKCAVYTSNRVPNVYLVVPAHADPSQIMRVIHYGPFRRLKDIELTPGTQLIGASADEVLQNIATQGFHLQGIEIRTQISEVGSAVAGAVVGAAMGGGPFGALIGAAIGAAVANQSNKKGGSK